MDALQTFLDNFLQEKFSAENIILSLINKKLKEMDIVLNVNQRRNLRKKIKNKDFFENATFRFNDKKALKAPLDLKQRPNREVPFTKKDLEDVEGKITEFVENIIPELASEIAIIILGSLKKRLGGHQREHRKDFGAFAKNIKKEWGKSLDLLEMFYFIATEAAESLNNYINFHGLISEDRKLVFDILTRLQARSCHITSEIIALLRNGFADGAHARWRTMHEISVIGFFISKHGNEVAERYLSHDAVESYKAAIKYQENAVALGCKSFTEEEIAELKKNYSFLIEKYGESFKSQYGWASSVLEKNNPHFADIESDVGLEYVRPFYKMASHNVHANPKGLFFKLGLTPEDGGMLLVGPSNLGLSEPGQWTAISLLQITTVLLTISPNLDMIVICNILKELEREIGDIFTSIELELKGKSILR